jgi:CRISPR-associated protein Cmr1
MRSREDELWGNASCPGLAELRIEQQSVSGQSVLVESLERSVGTGLRYGAFAAKNVTRLQGEAVLAVTVNPPRCAAHECADGARPSTSHEKLVREVDASLTAWLLFGGIGGRTRRGFGAVTSDGLPDPRAFVQTLPDQPIVPGVPALGAAADVVLSGPSFRGPEEAHRFAVDALRKFRQGKGIGRNPGRGDHPGRSWWPEPDEIRRQAGGAAPKHAPAHPVRAFPRGAFGMPIVFHFKRDDVLAGDPREAQLLPRGRTRMASPLILRPVSVAGQWHAMAVRLTVPQTDMTKGDLELQRRRIAVPIALTADQAGQISPLREHAHGNPDVLAAFLDFFAGLRA